MIQIAGDFIFLLIANQFGGGRIVFFEEFKDDGLVVLLADASIDSGVGTFVDLSENLVAVNLDHFQVSMIEENVIKDSQQSL
jgi:hypothetical protein